MAMYSASELHSKISHAKRELREFEPKVGKLYHLWIPQDSVFYVKKHFNIKTTPVAKNSKLRAITCINSNPDKPVRKCTLCDYIKSLWDARSNTSDKKEKAQLLGQINNLKTEYIYVNAIDVNDADLNFVAFRMTKGLFENFVLATNDTPVENIIWQFKKMDKNGKIEYTFLESPNDPKAIELAKDFPMLNNRSFAEGGPIDLVTALTYETTEAEYLSILAGEDVDDEEEEVMPTKPSKSVKADKKEVVVEEDASISLEDLEMEDLEVDDVSATKPLPPQAKVVSPPVIEDDVLVLTDDFELDEEPAKKDEPAKKAAPSAKAKAEAKKEEESLENIDLDNLSLDDDLTLEDDDKPVGKIMADAEFLNAHKKDTGYVDQIVEALVAQKKMKKTASFVENLKTAYAVMKRGNLQVEIEEIAF